MHSRLMAVEAAACIRTSIWWSAVAHKFELKDAFRKLAERQRARQAALERELRRSK